MRSYVYSGLIACFALDRLLEESAPDALLLFNGRQSSTRVAFELARSRGIRVVIHERGPRNETLMLIENATCTTLEQIRSYWRQWGDVPLTPDELEDVAGLMAEREHGRNTGWTPFTAPLHSHRTKSARGLGFAPTDRHGCCSHRPTTRSHGVDDYRSPFASQREWIEQTIEYTRRNPQIDLVIRVHPNTGSRRSLGANRAQLEEMNLLKENLPPNVQMIDPDDEISSYSLMELCSLGLVWVSTVGLELACKGKNVVIAAGSVVSGTSFVHTVEDASDATTGCSSRSPDRSPRPSPPRSGGSRCGSRMAYSSGSESPSPSFACRRRTSGKLAYDSLDALLPGRDAGVDRCVGIVLDGQPRLPTADCRGLSAEAPRRRTCSSKGLASPKSPCSRLRRS